MRKQIMEVSIALILVLLTVPLSSAIADPYADAVISYIEGPGVGDATNAPPKGNNDPSGAVGAPEYDSLSGNGLFVALGNGGSIILAFTDNVVINGDGFDLRIIEVGGPENGQVFVSDDGGVTFVILGVANGDTSFDLSATGLSFVNAVKVVDLAPDTTGFPYAGFDLDAVVALHSADSGCTPPTVSLEGDPLIIQSGTAVDFTASVADGCGDLIAAWDFDGDGIIDDTQGPQASPFDYDDQVYNNVGVYTVTVTITDAAGNIDEDSLVVVVYDPDGGFVTGGGWIWSPEGAFVADPSLTGKANFGFVSKYKKGATEPTGQTEFVFQAGDLNFHSSSYEWLVVTGSDYARFKGTGTINGSGEYKFMLWAGDDDPDTFRIKIWWEEGETENIVYDNGMGQPIGGGSIIVHTSKK